MESIKVIIVSTWNIPCGIATYTEDIIRNGTSEVDYEVFQISKSDWAFATKGKLEEIYKDFEHSIADRDIVYFQHEHGIWGAERGHKFALKNFLNFFKIALKRQKKIVISLHTDFSESRINKNKLFYQFKRWKNLRRIKPLVKLINQSKSIVYVHSEKSKYFLQKIGVLENLIKVVNHPCEAIMNIKEKDIQKCSTKFDYELNAIIIGMFGFVGRYKGHDIALNVLASLPKNYKLLIVGGQHPEDRSEYFNYLLEQIEELGVVDRVQITGWVSQEEAEAFLGRTKICIAPYREVGLSGSGALTWLLKSNRWIVVSKIDAFLPLLRTMPGIASTAEGSTNALKWAIETLAAKEFESSPVKKQIEDYVNSNSWNNHAKSLRCTYLNLLGVYDVSHLQPKQ